VVPPGCTTFSIRRRPKRTPERRKLKSQVINLLTMNFSAILTSIILIHFALASAVTQQKGEVVTLLDFAPRVLQASVSPSITHTRTIIASESTITKFGIRPTASTAGSYSYGMLTSTLYITINPSIPGNTSISGSLVSSVTTGPTTSSSNAAGARDYAMCAACIVMAALAAFMAFVA
jgi:hypothetical protein